ncbi:peptide chain release factor N(5)-glutamine methyltransferase [Staphylospora marina]|uniref:peptide chain release factor N(5)-glutamine methyltransferase n=1 Tax=Staphylospora marina TaxID=2490858 RepID=UPI000F5C1B7A|nr:peptide chain release factor N(5)-glutamine methyltransferase [Staphylospora marina]
MSFPRTVREAWLRASSFLREHRVASAEWEAEVMIRELTGRDRTRFFSGLSDPLPPETASRLEEWLRRRTQGEPLQYLLGHQDFFGRTFRVTPDVLIPRPETEILVETVIRDLKDVSGQPIHFVDAGTGSGAIAVTLALEFPEARVTAVDVSEAALAVARENARMHGVENRIHWVCGDFLKPLANRGISADVLVSNPPYIPTGDIGGLQPEVRDHEPRLALDGGTDGLGPYRVMAAELSRWPGRPDRLFFEIGHDQGTAVRQILKEAFPDAEVHVLPDLAGKDRIVKARLLPSV